MICEIDGLVLGGVQFGVLVHVWLWGVTVRAHFCILTVRRQGECSLGCWC